MFVWAGSSYSLEDERDYESDVSSRSSSKVGSNSLSVKTHWVSSFINGRHNGWPG